VELCQEMAELYGYEDEKYDALLDKYEYGYENGRCPGRFNAVKAELVPFAAGDCGTGNGR
jgi:carboxypeptidase Taq